MKSYVYWLGKERYKIINLKVDIRFARGEVLFGDKYRENIQVGFWIDNLRCTSSVEARITEETEEDEQYFKGWDEIEKQKLAEYKQMKMYLLVKEDLELGLAMVSVAHAVLACHLQFQDDLDYRAWLDNSFKKCVCKVNPKEFESAKKLGKHVIMTESSLDNQETAIVFCPRKIENLEKNFKFYKLWKG